MRVQRGMGHLTLPPKAGAPSRRGAGPRDLGLLAASLLGTVWPWALTDCRSSGAMQ